MSLTCARKQDHPENPHKDVPKTRGKPGPKSKKRLNSLSDVADVNAPKKEPKLPHQLEQFRIVQNNMVPAMAPVPVAPPAIPVALPPGQADDEEIKLVLRVVRFLRQDLVQTAQALVVPAGQPIVQHISAAAVANKINGPFDAATEVDMLRKALAETQKPGHQPPAHLANEAFVQNVANEYAPAQYKRDMAAVHVQHAPGAAQVLPPAAAPAPHVQLLVNPGPSVPRNGPAQPMGSNGHAASVKKGLFIDLTL